METEEATKNALVMPFIAALGYDVFDPTEVVPEFTADVGIKKGEKVDYVIKRGDDIVMLIEAKKVRQLEAPDEEFVKFFFQQANPNGRFVQSAKDQFGQLVKRTLLGLISDKVSDRLRFALAREDATVRAVDTGDTGNREQEVEVTPKVGGDDGIVTTEEELEGFRIVKAIVCDLLPPARIGYRDSKSYFAILVDDNNRKTLCRLHFNRSKKYVGIFDDQKNETRHAIDGVDGIYGLREVLRAAAQRWVKLESADGNEPTNGVRVDGERAP